MKSKPAERLLVAVCGLVTLAGSTSVARAARQNQVQRPPYTLAEYKAYEKAAIESNPQAKLKDLDQFVDEYPHSALLLYACGQYYQTYLSIKNYTQAVAYADKDLALGNKVLVSERLQALYAREIAYAVGCDDSAFQTPESWSKAKDAAIEGLQLLIQFPKPAAITDQDFATTKSRVSMLFHSVEQIAESREAGSPVACLSSADVPTGLGAGLQAPSGQFEDIIQDLSKGQNSGQ